MQCWPVFCVWRIILWLWRRDSFMVMINSHGTRFCWMYVAIEMGWQTSRRLVELPLLLWWKLLITLWRDCLLRFRWFCLVSVCPLVRFMMRSLHYVFWIQADTQFLYWNCSRVCCCHPVHCIPKFEEEQDSAIHCLM